MSNLGRQFDLFTDRYERQPDPYLVDLGLPDSQYAEDTYTLTSKHEQGKGDYVDQHGRVSVTHHSVSPVHVAEWSDWGMYQPEQGQQRLFKETYESRTPGKSTVDGMYFTKEARAMALPVLAVAARDAALNHGRTLIPSGDRSDHSERLVGRLAERGVAEATERTNANNIDFAPSMSRPIYTLGDKRGEGVLQQGKRDARAIVRQGRKPKAPKQETLW